MPKPNRNSSPLDLYKKLWTSLSFACHSAIFLYEPVKPKLFACVHLGRKCIWIRAWYYKNRFSKAALPLHRHCELEEQGLKLPRRPTWPSEVCTIFKAAQGLFLCLRCVPDVCYGLWPSRSPWPSSRPFFMSAAHTGRLLRPLWPSKRPWQPSRTFLTSKTHSIVNFEFR